MNRINISWTKINKIDKPLARLIRKIMKTKISKDRNNKGENSVELIGQISW